MSDSSQPTIIWFMLCRWNFNSKATPVAYTHTRTHCELNALDHFFSLIRVFFWIRVVHHSLSMPISTIMQKKELWSFQNRPKYATKQLKTLIEYFNRCTLYNEHFAYQKSFCLFDLPSAKRYLCDKHKRTMQRQCLVDVGSLNLNITKNTCVLLICFVCKGQLVKKKNYVCSPIRLFAHNVHAARSVLFLLLLLFSETKPNISFHSVVSLRWVTFFSNKHSECHFHSVIDISSLILEGKIGISKKIWTTVQDIDSRMMEIEGLFDINVHFFVCEKA